MSCTHLLGAKRAEDILEFEDVPLSAMASAADEADLLPLGRGGHDGKGALALLLVIWGANPDDDLDGLARHDGFGRACEVNDGVLACEAGCMQGAFEKRSRILLTLIVLARASSHLCRACLL